MGDKDPGWGLSRWASSGLRFLPPDDEGFTLQGDRWRLVYKGRRRSHRFTILGDTAFEYDCILNREPESNVITLLMEGADKFDFFRQPDFVKDPFLKGSYAVYKKETLLGEGTGKLCHIHRPLVIDNRGRRCWGELSVIGNELHITIPENWLSEAKYPVIVDPTVGTTTVGSYEKWYDPTNHDEDDELNWRPLWFEISIAVNKFLVSQTITGDCLAYVYINEGSSGDENRPVIYSDNGSKPLNRLTKEEGRLDSAVTSSKPKGWRTASFKVKNSIPSGTNIWFGVCSSYWEARFDYGQRIFVDEYDYQDPIVIPDVYPQEGLGWYDTHPEEVQQFYNYKVSWYFTYTAAQNYTRTLTQGVTLADNRKLTADYERPMAMNANNATLLGHSSDYYREDISGITVTGVLSRFRGFFRSLAEQVRTSDLINYCRDFLRAIALTVRPRTHEQRNLSAQRDITDQAGTGDSTARHRGFIRTLAAAVTAGDYAGKVQAWFRAIQEQAATFGEAGHLGDYVRGLYTEAGSMAETQHEGEYYRVVEDTAGSTAVSLRHLFIFIRLVTVGFVRDFLLRRFLKSNEELVVKSPVCRELILESTLH
ncbi:MAG: hypothetical protein LBD47_06720 [Treponema sp.]|nr:hypothetical protein [Treponema sp.]